MQRRQRSKLSKKLKMSSLLSKYDPSVWDVFRETSPDLHEDMLRTGSERFLQSNLELLKIVRQTMRPRSKMRVDQLADKVRFITRKSSANPGKYDVSLFEIARGPQASYTEDGVRVISAVGPTQLFKSSLLENIALYHPILDPKPIMMVQPTFKDAIDFMMQKLHPMFDATPAAKSRVYKKTKFDILCTGGHLTLAAATSENSLASRLAGAMLYDEPSKYELLRGRHPVFMGDKRLETFGPEGKSVRASSPTLEDNFMWEQYWKHSDRREPFVKCPNCQHDHVMRWFPTEDEKTRYLVKHGRSAPEYNVIWEVDKSTGNWDFKSATYVCPECRYPFSYGERRHAIQNLRWRQTKPFNCCDEYQDPHEHKRWVPTICETDGYEIVGRAICRHCEKPAVPNNHAGFNTSRLYSPAHLSELVEKWKVASTSVAGKQSFWNDELGLPWVDAQEIKLTADGLKAREEEFEFALPERAVVITAGVDSHPNRFEVEIVAWGRNFENWSLGYFVVPGSPDDPYTLAELDRILTMEFDGKDGRAQGIQAVCIDSAGRNEEGEVYTTKAVYAFSHQRQSRNVWAIRGAPEMGNTIAPVWPKTPTTVGNYKTPLYTLGTTLLKNEVRAQLAITTPGPGYCHFPENRDMSWYVGMLGEVKKKIQGTWRWRKKDSTPNEPFDCRVYALAALEGLKSRSGNPALIEDLADRFGIGIGVTESEAQHFDEKTLERIAEETAKSLEQNRAKPITQRKKAKLPARAPAADAPKETPRPQVPDAVANIVPNELELQSPGQRDPSPRVSPARRRVPWSRR